MRYIRWFDEVRSEDVALVGGKGANLGEMIAAGLPVPPGFCVTAEAYRHFVEVTGLGEEISSQLEELNSETPDKLQEGCTHIRGRILEAAVPTAISDDVLTGYAELAERLGRPAEQDVFVAVRSSATAEDLPTASFAGQQETFLNVKGNEEVLNRIRECWASLWTPRAVSYRARQGFDHGRVYLCAIVQAMIPSEVSGILFTANPITGGRGEAVINASWGLGEAVVSGLVTPDTVTVRKRDGRILSRDVGSKELTLEIGANGGTVELPTPDDRREALALEDEQVSSLLTLARNIEAHYGSPQDIEWAYWEGRFYVLQSRPITTLEEQASHPVPQDDFNRTMFVELLPDPLSPVFLSAIEPWLKDMLDFIFEIWGFGPPAGVSAIGVFYNQPYFNRRYVEEALAPLSSALRERLVAQVVNPWARHEAGLRGDVSWPFVRMLAGTLRFMLSVPRTMPRLIDEYRQGVEAISNLRLETASDSEIVRRIRSLISGHVGRLISFDYALIISIHITYQVLGTLLERHFREDTAELRAKLISGVTGNVTMETNTALWDLAQAAKASPEVTDALRTLPLEELRPALQRSPEGRGFLEHLDRFLATYGHREIRLDILYPTWGEDPTPVLGFVRGYLDADEAHSPHRQQARLVAEREELAERVTERLRSDRRGRYLITPVFRWILQRSQSLTRERDTMHFELTRVIPPFRQLMLELGRRWIGRGVIDQRDDVFFLSLDELEELARSPRPVKDLVSERRREWEANRQRPWPDIIRDEEEIYSGSVQASEGAKDQLRGIGGSPGIATGPARVIHGPDEFSRLRAGEILVAPLTNPVWTPLFAVAGGIVTEVGGILSHGAIVAREYGIPAVMSVSGVTRLVQDGQELVVDGNRGIVRISTQGNS